MRLKIEKDEISLFYFRCMCGHFSCKCISNPVDADISPDSGFLMATHGTNCIFIFLINEDNV